MLKNINLPMSTNFVLGIIAGIYLAYINFSILAFGIIAIIATYCLQTKKALALFLIFFVIGYYSYQQKISIFNNFENRVCQKEFSIIGKVVDYNKIEGGRFKHRLAIQTKLIANKTENIKANKIIHIYTQRFPRLYIDNLVLIKNIYFKPASTGFREYLIKNNIAASAFIPKLNFKKLQTFKSQSINGYKKFLMKKINAKMNLSTKAAFNSIFLGNKLWYKKELEAIKDNFQSWGTIHYLARSGLHLVIIAAIWQAAFLLFQIPLMVSNLIILLLMIVFTFLSWPALPFTRALIMLFAYRICSLFELQVNLLHILNISCIITLLTSPTSLFFLDFQLSFVLTYGLILFNEISRIRRS